MNEEKKSPQKIRAYHARPQSSKRGHPRGERAKYKKNNNVSLKHENAINQADVTKLVSPDDKKIRIVPLGGLGEVGKNMMAIEYGEDIIVIDSGMMFPTEEMLGVDFVIPDVAYLEHNKKKVRGVFITHGHEDHIGGIPFVLKKLSGVPFHATKLTAGMIERKLIEHGLDRDIQMRIIKADDKIKVGSFEIEPFQTTHSIPDAVGFVIRTPEGLIVHTGDFKVDFTPPDGKVINMARLAEYSREGVLLLLSDSTNAKKPGYAMSEAEVEKSFLDIFAQAEGRIIIASFASLINRIQNVINGAHRFGRKVAISGRSMQNNLEVAAKLGYLKVPAGTIVKLDQAMKMPDNKVVIMSTGSQGEPMSALARMAEGIHRQITIKKGDMVILSSTPIPGNERKISNMLDNILRRGASVIDDRKSQVHVSGHAYREELKLILNLLKPKFFIPVHGEYHMLCAHGELAAENGVAKDNVIVMENGEVTEITKDSIIKLKRRIPINVVMVDGLGVGDVGQIVLRDRQAMAQDGVFVTIATIDKQTGKLIGSPDIISRGFVYMREQEELINGARDEVRRIVKSSQGSGPQNDWSVVRSALRDELGRYLYEHTKRRPMVLPVIISV